MGITSDRKIATRAGLVSVHASADGTLVRANASYKSLVPILVELSGEQFKDKIRAGDKEETPETTSDAGEGSSDRGPSSGSDKSNPGVDFRGEKRSNKTHRSGTDPDCRFVSKGSSGTGAYPGYTVNAVMENRNRFLLGIDVTIFRGPASETEGCLSLLDRTNKELGYRPQSLGADKGYFAEGFLNALFDRQIEPPVAIQGTVLNNKRFATVRTAL